jgi:hypothetical protein
MAEDLANIEIDKLLKEKVDNLLARKMVRSLVVAEMKSGLYNKSIVKEVVEKVLTSDSGRTIIREITDRSIAPKEDNTLQTDRKFVKISKK